MKIEIRKAGFVNKGAELMLRAIQQEVRGKYRTVDFVMEPRNRMATYLKRAEAGLYQKLKTGGRRRALTNFAVRYSPQWRKEYGIVLDREIDAVLDAAGFAYGDQFGAGRTVELAKFSRRCRKLGTRLILLPQAFGPFSSPEIRKAMEEVIGNADFIFAREKVSYEHLCGISGERENIRRAPDFTNLVIGSPPENFPFREGICFIPNNKMIEKSESDVAERYISFLSDCVRYVKKLGEESFILVHEGRNDQIIAEKVSESAGGVPVLMEEDPLRVKGIIGQCKAVVSSRFHGIVSAFSQGIPALATGWSHKYWLLFEDYGFPEGLIDMRESGDQWKSRMNQIIDDGFNKSLRGKLAEKAVVFKKQSAEMWGEVFTLLDEAEK